jgi:hypothetical protein
MKRLAFFLMLPVLSLAAESPCDYGHNVVGSYTKKIDRVIDISRSVYPETESVKTCQISMSVVIDGEVHDARGQFSFSPDMSENTACGHAEQRAKENIIRKVSPEILRSNTTMNCQNPQTQHQANNTPAVTHYPPGSIIPLTELNPRAIPAVPYFVYNPNFVAPVQQKKEPEISNWEMIKFGVSILPLLMR